MLSGNARIYKIQRQQDEQQRNSVDPDVVIGAERLYPRNVLNELHLIRIVTIEPEPQRKPNDEAGDHHQIRPPPDQRLILFVKEEKTNHSCQWPEGNDAQDMLAKKVHLWGPPQNVANENQNAQDHDKSVILGVSGLDEAQRPAHCLDKAADELYDAVHDPAIPPAGTQRTFDGCPGGTVHGAIDHLCVEFPQSHPGILRTVDEKGVVQFVDVVLVQKNPIQPAVLPDFTLLFPASLAVLRIGQSKSDQSNRYRCCRHAHFGQIAVLQFGPV